MIRKFLFYGIGAVVCLAFVCSTQWGEFKFPSQVLQAEVEGKTSDVSDGTVFLTNYEVAIQTARQENKPVLLFFMADNCKYSKAMQEVAFHDPEVKKLSGEFVCAQINLGDRQNEELRDSLNIASSPTIQFTTADGAPLQRLSGEQSGERVAEQMRAVLTSIAWREANISRRSSIIK